jgi:single-stranded-DNA-specific exonuclease
MHETDSLTNRKTVQKRWIFPATPSQTELLGLDEIKGLNPSLKSVLVRRGIATESSLKSFFNPTLADLHDPFLMKDMDRAVKRIRQAMDQKEAIMVFGDYDVDGTTATSLVFKYLKWWMPDVSYYIPDRYKEGYGVSFAGIEEAERRGAKLIIALDCGIKSIEHVAFAKAKGIDFIICDHHLPGAKIPEAAAVLDPKQADCAYPFKELSGCGVGFKLMQACVAHFDWDEDALFSMLDLVAVSIAADIVPITGENRVLMHLGLEKLNSEPSPGIEALMQISGFRPGPDGKYGLKVDRLVFGLAPRINAAGRIGHGEGAVELLTAASPDEGIEKAGKVDLQNGERKELDKSITAEALALLHARENFESRKSTVLFQPNWHKGVIGIVASRCIENHYRPTIILTESEGKLTGSGRSIHGFDLYAALEACSEHLIQFGGHFHAAGLSLKPEKLEAFIEAFEEQAQKRLQVEDLVPRLELDGILPLRSVSQSLYDQLKRMAPFGPGNMNPLFAALQVRDNGQSRLLPSKTGGPGHIKFCLTEPGLEYQGRPYALEGIGFGMEEHWPDVVSGKPFDIAFHLEENEWKDRKSLQLMVKEVRFHS